MPRAKTQTCFWTPERDQRLKELWAEQPRRLAAEIAEDLGISDSYVYDRVRVLNLPRRNPKGTADAKDKRRDPVKEAEKRALRVVAAHETTPCPYVDPRASLDPVTRKVPCCGVMVDRRMRRDGSKPSQYCKTHEALVLPMAAGRSLESGSRAGIGLIAMSSRGRAW
jgi:hypothetical protein